MIIVDLCNLLIKVCELLLLKGADVDSQDRNGNTALHIASYQGHPDTVQVLLSWGASLCINGQEKTPLDVAREEEEGEVVEILEEWMKENGQVNHTGS